jgi:PIF1-like helicase
VLISIKNKQLLREEWNNVDFVLIDEISLVSQELLSEIDHALCFAKENPDEWFGGINVIFSGDFYQYPPVQGTPLYCPIHVGTNQSNNAILRRLGCLAWKSLTHVIDLHEQNRMQGDPPYAQAVYRLCHRECTMGDLEIFNSRCVVSTENPSGIRMDNVSNIDGVAIVPTNRLRELLNVKKVLSKTGGQHQPELIICAADDIVQGMTLPKSSREWLLKQDFNGIQSSLPGFLPLYEGMPVVLRSKNLSTDLKITNGSQGIIRKIFTKTCTSGFTIPIGTLSISLRALFSCPIYQKDGTLSSLPHGHSMSPTSIVI